MKKFGVKKLGEQCKITFQRAVYHNNLIFLRNVLLDCIFMALYLSLPSISAMPFFDIQKKLGIDLDHWLSIQSAEQPHRIPSRCHAFEKEWIECSHGIGGIRARKECKIEYEDLLECLLRQKTVRERWRWELSYFLISLGLLFSIFNGH